MLEKIMQTKLKTIPYGATIIEAAEKMRQESIGGLLIEGKGGFVGFLTDTDIVRKGVGNKKNLTDTKVEELMSTTLPTIQVSKTSHEAFDLMGDLGLRHLLICNGDEIVGLVSLRDLLLYFRSLEPNIGVD
ncbi:MAG: CBS domain-containing protein [Nitrospirales bacterium]|nr:CBS domain-containing protein [Nitrospirales bacterium]